MNRKQAREKAFCLIFQLDFHIESLEELIETEKNNIDDLSQFEYIESTVRGVWDNLKDIDDLISKNLKKGWTVLRLSKVMLAVMRLAVYEMVYSDSVPANIAINEALEIVKIYDDPESCAFANGILGGVYKETADAK